MNTKTQHICLYLLLTLAFSVKGGLDKHVQSQKILTPDDVTKKADEGGKNQAYYELEEVHIGQLLDPLTQDLVVDRADIKFGSSTSLEKANDEIVDANLSGYIRIFDEQDENYEKNLLVMKGQVIMNEWMKKMDPEFVYLAKMHGTYDISNDVPEPEENEATFVVMQEPYDMRLPEFFEEIQEQEYSTPDSTVAMRLLLTMSAGLNMVHKKYQLCNFSPDHITLRLVTGSKDINGPGWYALDLEDGSEDYYRAKISKFEGASDKSVNLCFEIQLKYTIPYTNLLDNPKRENVFAMLITYFDAEFLLLGLDHTYSDLRKTLFMIINSMEDEMLALQGFLVLISSHMFMKAQEYYNGGKLVKTIINFDKSGAVQTGHEDFTQFFFENFVHFDTIFLSVFFELWKESMLKMTQTMNQKQKRKMEFLRTVISTMTHEYTVIEDPNFYAAHAYTALHKIHINDNEDPDMLYDWNLNKTKGSNFESLKIRIPNTNYTALIALNKQKSGKDMRLLV